MSNIAIIGSGITGLVSGIGLLEQGHQVTIFTALGADDWMTKVPPTGAACRFHDSLELERELGINHWDDSTPIDGIHVTYSAKPGRRLLDLQGRFTNGHALAIDVRLQSKIWTEDFEKRGGKIVIGNVGVGLLDEIAQEHDLTLVAVGKADIDRLFDVDERRSVYADYQRKLIMVVIRNIKMNREDDGIMMNHGLKFNFVAGEGEQFSVPYWHRDGYQCWNCIFEMKEGHVFDHFDPARSSEECLSIAKDLIKHHIPWDYEWIRDAQVTDPNGWLKGWVKPCYKKPVARLPSGAKVMAIGDTANAVDPIGAQGANNCYRQIRVLLRELPNAGGEFTEAWMNATFDKYVEEIGGNANVFTNMFLEPFSKPLKSLLIAQYGSTGLAADHSINQQIANAFCDNFDNPNILTQLLHDQQALKAWLNRLSGGRANQLHRQNALKIAGAQIRQMLGLPRNNQTMA